MAKPRRVLVTFVGKGQRSRTRPGYDEATYDFGDGRIEASRVFGMALLRHLGRQTLGDLVLVGTSGSDYHVLWKVSRYCLPQLIGGERIVVPGKSTQRSLGSAVMALTA
jgi:hypothetical protein